MAQGDDVRWYFDASVLGVARGFAYLRADTTFPGAEGCPVEDPGVLDHIWLPIVAERGWAVIMRDKRIRRRPWERSALIEAGVIAFVLTGAGQKTKWEVASLLVKWWDAMEDALELASGPAMYAVTGAGLRPIQLTSE